MSKFRMQLSALYLLLFTLVIALSPELFASGTPDFKMPTKSVRENLFDDFISTIERLDGDGLIPRKGRPESWKQTTAKLKKEFLAAKTTFELGQVLKRLDQTYSNIHAHIKASEAIDFHAVEGRVKPAAIIRPEIVNQGQRRYQYRLSSVDQSMFLNLEPNHRPKAGDEVVAINGRSMNDWSNENWIYCKYPHREQCEIEFWDNFRKELRSWNRRKPLTYTLVRDDKKWTVPIPIQGQTKQQAQAGSESTKTPPCDIDPKLYEPFTLVYEGRNACAYEDKSQPGIAILRIKSFNYRASEHPVVKDIRDETKLFWNRYWQKRAPQTKKLIVDVTDNGGGDSVISWFRLFFSSPFQEQYVQFKNIKELENDDVRRALFYEENAKQLFFESLKSRGEISKLSNQDFLPPVPQFCATDEKDCREELFKPLENGFKGDVRIVLNQWCHSSCVGFVWNMKDVLKERVRFVGHPDNGDSTYGRVFVAAKLNPEDPRGYEIHVLPRRSGQSAEANDGILFQQAVSVTRSTDSNGNVISAIPQKVDVWIPLTWDMSWFDWQQKAVQAAVGL